MTVRLPPQSAARGPMPAPQWQNLGSTMGRSYVCAYCGDKVGSAQAYYDSGRGNYIYICPMCKQPTYFDESRQIPAPPFGEHVKDLPPNIERLYGEARNCMSVSAYTGAVMLCRKVLMNVAVAEDAPEGKSFAAYVDHLAEKGFVPPKGRGWVDHIRSKGNEANHEIAAMTKGDAEELILFTGMLLKFIYELPARRPSI